jgi:hypothetical protein
MAVHLHDGTDQLDIETPLVIRGQGDFEQRTYARADRFVLYRRAGRFAPWALWKRVASRWAAESQAVHRVEASGDSVAVEDAAPDGAGPRRVEYRPGFAGAVREVLQP